MKQFLYFIFAFNFHIGRLFGLKNSRVALLSPHHEKFNDSLGCMGKYFKEEGYKTGFITTEDLALSVSSPLKSLGRIISFFTVKAFFLARSKYVFLNDNFSPLSMLNFDKNAVIIQLWHAEGAFKRFGLSLPLSEKIRRITTQGNKRLTAVICSSPAITKIYAEAFGVPEKKVLPLGSPRTDELFCGGNESVKEKIYKKYPYLKGKKTVLYAPTFRDDPKENSRLLESLDVKKFNAVLSGDYSLILRLHPQLHKGVRIPEGVIDMTEYPDFGELARFCDVLVTDYSSVCMDFILLKKPCYFYAFDLDRFNTTRSFYHDYGNAPGVICKTFDELLEAIGSGASCPEKLESFIKLHLASIDGSSTKRIAEFAKNIK